MDSRNLECRMYESKYPEVGTTVMIQVKKVSDMGAWVSLLEYNNIEGMILFWELSNRSIRSVSSFIKVGRIEPAMVFRVDKDRGYIDLSMRRVGMDDFQACEERYNKSKLVHSILRHVAETLSVGLEELYVNLGWPLYRKYGHAFEGFKVMVSDPDVVLSSLSREVKEVGPDGQEVTKVVPAITEEIKEVLIKDIKIRMTPQPTKEVTKVVPAITEEMKEVLKDINKRMTRHPRKAAMGKAEAAGNEDCPVKIIKLVPISARPIFARTKQTRDKEQGISVLTNAITACAESIEKHKGKLTVKEAPRAVSEWDDKLLAEHMAELSNDNEEVSGDEGSVEEEEEDTGMGDTNMENMGIIE